MNEETKIYMAGKISINGWRHNIVKGLREHDYWGCWNENLHEKYLSISKNLIYTGPFFIGCDHGCSHGDSTHGAKNSACSQNNAPTKNGIFRGCIEQISDADYIFCWIDGLDCYGTLFELGIAYEKGKKIFIGIDKKLAQKEILICECGTDFSDGLPKDVGKGCCHSGPTITPDDLWFIKNSGKSDYYNNPMEAWDSFLYFLNPKLKEQDEEFIKTLDPSEQEDFSQLKDKQPLSKTILYFKRNRNIVEQLKELYQNKCQICQFTFKKDNGENYSETHHLIPLGQNGEDDIKNLIVVCPNCHKKLHYAKKEKYDIKYKEEHYNLIKDNSLGEEE